MKIKLTITNLKKFSSFLQSFSCFGEHQLLQIKSDYMSSRRFNEFNSIIKRSKIPSSSVFDIASLLETESDFNDMTIYIGFFNATYVMDALKMLKDSPTIDMYVDIVRVADTNKWIASGISFGTNSTEFKFRGASIDMFNTKDSRNEIISIDNADDRITALLEKSVPKYSFTLTSEEFKKITEYAKIDKSFGEFIVFDFDEKDKCPIITDVSLFKYKVNGDSADINISNDFNYLEYKKSPMQIEKAKQFKSLDDDINYRVTVYEKMVVFADDSDTDNAIILTKSVKRTSVTNM